MPSRTLSTMTTMPTPASIKATTISATRVDTRPPPDSSSCFIGTSPPRIPPGAERPQERKKGRAPAHAGALDRSAADEAGFGHEVLVSRRRLLHPGTEFVTRHEGRIERALGHEVL